ncbi:MAG TPA: ABC transporter permease [Candidatus Binatia bacterium]|nr:ABC transporter permease [Candidatus Binatia bacterium]
MGLAYESFLLGRRAFLRWARVPGNWLSTLFFPLIQLVLFSQLFKDIIQLPGFEESSYLAYLAPGQIVFAVFLGVSWVGINLLMDYHSGYLDKLRVTPINHLSILFGEMVPLFFTAALMGGVILVTSIVLGASLVTGIAGALGILALSGLFAIAWAGTSFVPALLTKNEQAAGTLSLLFFPLAFMSTAFVPAERMPEWLQVVNNWNPISYVIEAQRGLMSTGFDPEAMGKALIATAILFVITQAATIWAFRRLTTA